MRAMRFGASEQRRSARWPGAPASRLVGQRPSQAGLPVVGFPALNGGAGDHPALLEGHGGVAAGGLVGPVGDDQHAAAVTGRRSQDAAENGVGELDRRARSWARPAAARGRAPAGRGPRPGAGALRPRARRRRRRRVCRDRRATRPRSGRAGRRAARRRWRRRRRRVGPGSGWPAASRRRAAPVGPPARRRRARPPGATATRRCRRRESVPRSSGQNRRSALTRLDLPAPLEPVTARLCPAGRDRLIPSRARGRVSV